MKSKLIAAIAITGGLSLAMTGTVMAGTASAATASHPKPHKVKHVTQIPGKQLAKGLLPGSVFGFGTTTSSEIDSGKKLLSPQALASVSSEPCSDLLVDLPLFGQTAVAENNINNSAAGGIQAISQFASSKAAWAFYGKLKARYNSCVSFSGREGGDQTTGPITLSIDLNSVTNTKVGSNYAFAVSQVAEVSDSFGDGTFSIDTKIVADGTNIYMIWNSNAVDTQIPNSQLTAMIKRTLALYKS
jgi:hypothetical protein